MTTSNTKYNWDISLCDPSPMELMVGPRTPPQELQQSGIGLGADTRRVSIHHPQASLTAEPRAVRHRIMERFRL
eukprot:1364550-Pyramimonas_sp.AAC.1